MPVYIGPRHAQTTSTRTDPAAFVPRRCGAIGACICDMRMQQHAASIDNNYVRYVVGNISMLRRRRVRHVTVSKRGFDCL